MNPTKKIIDDFDNGAVEFFMSASEKEIDAYLEEEGFDINQINAKSESFANRIQFEIQVEENINQQKDLLQRAQEKVKSIIHNSITHPKERLKELFTNQNLSVQFRNLDNLTEKDIEEILSEIDLVYLMEELEDENN